MQPRSLEDPAGRENVNLQTWTVWTWLQWGACIRWHIRMGSESQLVLQINKLKYQKSCIFKKLPKSAKRCKKCQNGLKSAKSFQIVQKSAKKCQKGLFYLCLLFSSQSLKHHHSQTVKAEELKFLEDVHCSSPTTCYMSHVTCHLSLVRCQVVVCLYQTVKARDLTFWEYDHFPPSVTCHLSYVTVTVTTVRFITVTVTVTITVTVTLSAVKTSVCICGHPLVTGAMACMRLLRVQHVVNWDKSTISLKWDQKRDGFFLSATPSALHIFMWNTLVACWDYYLLKNPEIYHGGCVPWGFRSQTGMCCCAGTK